MPFSLHNRSVERNGKTKTYYYFNHPGSVAILAERDGRFAFIRQLRPAIDRVILEVPAGTLEPGEDPTACALRELAEETGLRARRIEKLGSVYASPGYSSERMHIYLATDLVDGPTQFDEGELIEPDLVWITAEELTSMIADGSVDDAKTIVALDLYERLYDK